ncbi:MAG: restriction endonuclease subunit S [Alphaproteobacteria bacterium]|nr:restriction endonuclease subunit S [Alphaproteobacteria bacterium]
MSSESPITEVVEFNPPRQIKRGAIAPFVDMAALPERQRDIYYVAEREFTGGGSRFQNGDTLFARITPCLENGKTAKVSTLPDGVVAHGSTEFIVMAAKAPEYDEDYVYYLARHPDFRAYAEARMEGTSGRQRVSWQALSDFTLALPPPDQRKTIGAVLRKLDDKIAINRRMNQTLEAMAQAIFKSWFVDFDPVKAKIAAKQEGRDPQRAGMSAISGKPDAELDALPPEQYEQLAATAALFPDEMEESELGQIPKGWKAGSLSNFASFQNGYAFKTKDWTDSGHPVVKIGNVKPGIIDLSGCSYVTHETVNGLDRFALKKGDLLVGMTGYVGETGLVPALDSVGYLNQRVGRISTANGINDIGYPYCLVRDPAYKSYAESKAHGSAQANVSGKDLMDFPAVVPDARAQNIFNAQAEKIINTLLSFHEESQSLIALRDTLLPKLLSGELSVTEATAEVEI